MPTKDRKTKMASKFLTTTPEGQRQWSEAFKILRKNYFPTKILFPTKLLISCAGRKKNPFQACSLSTMSPPIILSKEAIKAWVSIKKGPL